MRIISNRKVATAFLRRTSLEPSSLPREAALKLKAVFGRKLGPREAVALIIREVRERGDAALFDLSLRLDGVRLSSLEVRPEERERALTKVEPELFSALELAAQRVSAFYEAKRPSFSLPQALGETVRPLALVGIYVPGGTACYPSTVLMSVIPARIAGVEEIIMATPPGKGGEVPAATLAAASLAGAGRIFKVGGAQAIAALAYGTETIPGVDKVCGPGGLFVTLAKREVYGDVDIDGLYGPTETVIIADDSADPSLVAADLLAQAEHDVLATALLITTSRRLAQEVDREVEHQLPTLERREIALASLEARGAIILVNSMAAALELANFYAPEHLCLLVKQPRRWLGKVKNAGGVFLGESSPEALGDYIAGPSHVMPTGGTARFRSPLGVEDFLKRTTVVALGEEELASLAAAAAAIARAEGLTAHARALELRLKRLP